MLLKLLFTSIFWWCSASSNYLHVQKCQEYHGLSAVQHVQVSNCTELPCLFKAGESDEVITFDFIPDKKYDTLTTKVFSTRGASAIKFHIVPAQVSLLEACNFIKRKDDGQEGCPVLQGVTYTYSNTLHIFKSFPPGETNITYALRGTDRATFPMCFDLPSVVESKIKIKGSKNRLNRKFSP